MTYAMFLSPHRLIKVLEIISALAILVALVRPGVGSVFFKAVEERFGGLAHQRRKAILCAALFPMMVRALMLPWFPAPKPIVHDEFSYLLQGDTFAHGRIANATPPYWKHFETEYTLLTPTYASQYQPGQGLILAVGEVLFHHPWWAVWISVGIMCGAICWALGFVVPPGWALFGAFVSALQFGIFGVWMNSYFGGALSATAGALVLGAITGLKDPLQWRNRATLCAGGILLLFATRPFEAVLWSGVAVVYGWSYLRKNFGRKNFGRKSFPRPVFAWRRLAVPFAVVFVIGAGMLAYYNWRVTGSPAVPPYLAYQRIYGTPQPYWWQPPVVVTDFDYPELRDNYLNQVHLYEARYSPSAILASERDRLGNFWQFFIGPFLTPALVFIPAVFRDRRIRPWLLASLPFIADKATYHAWFPAHSGPATVLIVLVLVQCWRHLRAWRRSQGTGLGMSRTLMAAFCLAVFLGGVGRALEPVLPSGFRHIVPIWESLYAPRRLRDDVSERLAKIPGKHLVFVRYSPDHCFCEEWVSNEAEPMNQRIVYVRPDTPESDEALIESFRDFDAWVIEPDLHPYHLSRISNNEIAALSSPEPPGSDDLFHSN